MKVLMINGSPRANGNTSIALNEMKTVFEKEGVDAEIVQVGSEAVREARRRRGRGPSPRWICR